MISSLRIKNFKCFDDETIALRPLSLIAGANGGGKSSLLQALLLAHQAAGVGYVRLNGPSCLDLGRASDILYQSAKAEPDILVEATLDSGEVVTRRLHAASEDSLVLEVAECSGPSGSLDLAYLTAERVGPRDVLDIDSVPAGAMGVGARGEFTAQVLLERERDPVHQAIRHPSTDESLEHLGKQVELWLQDVAPGIQIRPLPVPGTNLSAVRLRHRGVDTDWFRPPNIGFGISYALPIIVAGLLARPGSLLLVENPEAHLHPGAQSKLGRFLGVLAAAGIQVIAETHSDHILNGARLAAVDQNHPLRNDQVVIQYFHGDRRAERRATAIDVNPSGKLSAWPAGFFDQIELDLAALARAGCRGD